MSSVRKNQLKWIKALRSGKFKQGKGQLYRKKNNTYCCLGVANEVCKLGEIEEGTLCSTYEKLGLDDPAGSISERIFLTVLNDRGLYYNSRCNINKEFTKVPFTFDEIADILEIEYILGVNKC